MNAKEFIDELNKLMNQYGNFDLYVNHTDVNIKVQKLFFSNVAVYKNGSLVRKNVFIISDKRS